MTNQIPRNSNTSPNFETMLSSEQAAVTFNLPFPALLGFTTSQVPPVITRVVWSMGRCPSLPSLVRLCSRPVRCVHWAGRFPQKTNPKCVWL